MLNARASLSLLALGATAALAACGSNHESFFSTPGFIEPSLPAGAGGEAGEAGEASVAGAPSAAGSSVGGSAGAEAGSGQGGRAQAGAAQGGAAQGGAAQGGAAQGGAAGAAQGGSGGAPPMPVVGIACQNKLTKPAPSIGDFEQGVTGWGAYINNYIGIVQLSAPGAAQTEHAATFAGTFADQSGLYHELACSDVSGFDGISFWAKGKGGEHIRFLTAIPETQPVADGGDCDVSTKTCWDHPGKLFVLTNQWQRYTVGWSDLAQYGWGSPASFGHVINSLIWINDGYSASFEFSIDQVSLYKGSPE